MPLYEYECNSCAHRREVIQRMDDPPPAECAECGGSMRRLLSAPAFQFKGTGWYATDYAAKDKKSSGASDSDSKGGKSDESGKGDKGGKEVKGDKATSSDSGSSTATKDTKSSSANSASPSD